MRLIVTVSLILILTRCAETRGVKSTTPTGSVRQTTSASSWPELEKQLRSAGLELTAAGEVEQPFWTRTARVFTTAGGDLQLYEFATDADASAAAAQVGAGGGTIGTSSMAWMTAPHFFRSGRVIVIYLGGDDTSLATLQSVFGAQFAGR